MATYLISVVEIRSESAFEAYRARAAASIDIYGGKYIVRGGKIGNLEGRWTPKSIVIVEFPDEDRLRVWYKSDEYALALAFKEEALTRELIIAEGV